MNTRLFDANKVAPDSAMLHGESHYSYVSRSDRAPLLQLRETFEDWFALVPPSEQADVRGRIRSGEDSAFLSAFWEMYLARLFAGLGHEIEWHPLLAHTSKRPDFRLTAASGDVTYLEAVSVGLPRATLAEQRRLQRLYDQINTWSIHDYFLSVTPHEIGPADLASKPLKKGILKWITTLSVEEIERKYNDAGWPAIPFHAYRADGWHLEITVILKKPSARGDDSLSALGMSSPSVGGLIDNVMPLRSVLTEKSNDYGVLDAPFVIAALHNSLFSPAIHDAATALWGCWEDDNGAFRLLSMDRNLSPILCPSLWRDTGGSRYTRTSAVIVAAGLLPWNMAEVQPQLWLNDKAAKPLVSLPRLGTWTCTNDLVEFRQSQLNIERSMGLAPDWPGWEPND